MPETTLELVGALRTILSAIKFDTRLLTTIDSDCEHHRDHLEVTLNTLRALRPTEDVSGLDALVTALEQLHDIAVELDMDDASMDLDMLEQTLEEEAEDNA